MPKHLSQTWLSYYLIVNKYEYNYKYLYLYYSKVTRSRYALFLLRVVPVVYKLWKIYHAYSNVDHDQENINILPDLVLSVHIKRPFSKSFP